MCTNWPSIYSMGENYRAVIDSRNIREFGSSTLFYALGYSLRHLASFICHFPGNPKEIPFDWVTCQVS